MKTIGREIARRSGGRVEVRAEPFRCRLRLSASHASDDHVIDATFSCSMQALEDRAEREMLAETLLCDRDFATIENVVDHFAPPLRDALARLIATQPAETWLAEASHAQIAEALRGAAKPVAFSCGVELLPPFEVMIESPTLQREQLESMQRRLAEKRAAGQVEHVQRATELLKQFTALREAGPTLSPGQILDRVSPADRGSMLETLLLASAGEMTSPLWAVAGTDLLRIDPRTSPPATKAIALPSELGPLRSVQRSEDRLLVGAQSGVMLVQADDPRGSTLYRHAAGSSPLGFNSVASAAGMIWASHGDVGVVGWDVGGPNEPALVKAAPGARNLVALDDGRALFSAAGGVFVVDREGVVTAVPGSAGGYVLIAIDREQIILVREDGIVQHADRSTLELTDGSRRCGAVTAAATLPWLGTTRLLLASADGPVYCIGGDDELVTQYASAHRGLRAIAACADTIAALSADRQRIILWKTWDGRQPFAEIHVASMARHRAADVSF